MDIQSLIEKYDDLFNEAWDRWETTQCAIAQAEANAYHLILRDLEKL